MNWSGCGFRPFFIVLMRLKIFNSVSIRAGIIVIILFVSIEPALGGKHYLYGVAEIPNFIFLSSKM